MPFQPPAWGSKRFSLEPLLFPSKTWLEGLASCQLSEQLRQQNGSMEAAWQALWVSTQKDSGLIKTNHAPAEHITIDSGILSKVKLISVFVMVKLDTCFVDSCYRPQLHKVRWHPLQWAQPCWTLGNRWYHLFPRKLHKHKVWTNGPYDGTHDGSYDGTNDGSYVYAWGVELGLGNRRALEVAPRDVFAPPRVHGLCLLHGHQRWQQHLLLQTQLHRRFGMLMYAHLCMLGWYLPPFVY